DGTRLSRGFDGRKRTGRPLLASYSKTSRADWNFCSMRSQCLGASHRDVLLGSPSSRNARKFIRNLQPGTVHPERPRGPDWMHRQDATRSGGRGLSTTPVPVEDTPAVHPWHTPRPRAGFTTLDGPEDRNAMRT